MLRILMVLEDYGELMFLQTVLKKMGFDVDAIQNPRAFSKNVLGMNPDVLVMTAVGKRVNGIELSHSLRRVRGVPKIILLQNGGAAQPSGPDVDGWLGSPVAATDLLAKIAEVCGLNNQVLQEKFQKLKLKELEEEKSRVLKMPGSNSEPELEKGDGSSHEGLTPSTMPSQEREERYKKFLVEAVPTKEGFSVKDVQAKIKELRRDEDSQHLEDLEKERRAFVEHLFRKKA